MFLMSLVQYNVCRICCRQKTKTLIMTGKNVQLSLHVAGAWKLHVTCCFIIRSTDVFYSVKIIPALQCEFKHSVVVLSWKCV
jgi:hypothetical protein